MFERDGREPIDKATRDQCFHKFGGHCAYCGIQLKKSFHVDHVIPWAGGGPDDIMNFFPACKYCNTLKNSLSLEQFRTCIEEYHKKAGVIVSERFGILKVIAPVKVEFWFEKQGYTFPYDLIKSMMRINND
jgi:5-methylcytosine-specific restriction endonuclease McrA